MLDERLTEHVFISDDNFHFTNHFYENVLKSLTLDYRWSENMFINEGQNLISQTDFEIVLGSTTNSKMNRIILETQIKASLTKKSPTIANHSWLPFNNVDWKYMHDIDKRDTKISFCYPNKNWKQVLLVILNISFVKGKKKLFS